MEKIIDAMSMGSVSNEKQVAQTLVLKNAKLVDVNGKGQILEHQMVIAENGSIVFLG